MIIVTVNNRCKFSCPARKFRKLVKTICSRFGIANATVSIAIVGNSHIRKVNEKFLRRRTATDCISFDLSDPGDERRLFELVVNGQKAKSEGAKRHHSEQAELALYITHGLLHLLGFDDHKSSEAKNMHKLEDEILLQQDFGAVFGKTAEKARAKC
jgi:probable rRNA maturation factor